jgi:hypothetical protein
MNIIQTYDGYKGVSPTARQEPDAGQSLLRARSERPICRRTAEQHDELATKPLAENHLVKSLIRSWSERYAPQQSSRADVACGPFASIPRCPRHVRLAGNLGKSIRGDQSHSPRAKKIGAERNRQIGNRIYPLLE